VLFNIKASLEQLIARHLPAVNSAGCHFTPVAGLTGESWKIATPTVALLARIQSADKSALGVVRTREKAILRHVNTLNIAPRVRLFSAPWLVVEWLEGVPYDEALFGQPASVPALAVLVVGLQRLAPSGHRLNLPQQFSRYWQQIDRSRLTPDWLRLQRYFTCHPMPTPLKLAVLHMDIHAGNLIQGRTGLQLIDWEYAADGDIALELAALFRGNNWNQQQQQDFLAAYHQAGGYQDRLRLQQQIRRWTPWIEYLMLMWFEVRWQQTGDKRYSDWAQPLREQLFTRTVTDKQDNRSRRA